MSQVFEIRYPSHLVAEMQASENKTCVVTVPNDRGYSKKDQIVIQGYEPSKTEYTGEIVTGQIVHIDTCAEDDRLLCMRIKKLP